MSRNLDDLYPQTRQKVDRVLAALTAVGISYIVTDTFRSFAEQDKLYAQGRTSPGAIVTHARAGQSFHNVRRAVDICFKDERGKPVWNGPWDLYGETGREAGLVWGGDWHSLKDKPHVEDRYCARCGEDHASATAFNEQGDCRLDLE